MECFVCGVSGEKAYLIDVISGEGISKICKKCQFEEGLPLVKKQIYSEDAGNYGERKQSVYERLSKISGVDVQKREVPKINEDLKSQEMNLKKIVDKNFEKKVDFSEPKSVVRDDLIENFHWIIMRSRRSKKLTQAQLGEKIEEPEVSIHMAEKGVLPKDYVLARKLENFFSIRIVKEQVGFQQELPKKISFEDDVTKALTISDLKDMRKKREMELFNPEKVDCKVGGDDEVLMEQIEENVFVNPEAEIIDEQPEFVEGSTREGEIDKPPRVYPEKSQKEISTGGKKDLSEDEINDLIFGKKS
jgi:ribosome-binding protein aMBF1 (putative translation factor)